MGQLLHADAFIDYTAAGGVKGTLPEVRQWLAEVMAGFPMTQHLVTNRAVRVDGDTATCRSCLFNPMGVPDNDSLMVFFEGGYYRDKLVRTAGRLAHRRAHRGADVLDAPAPRHAAPVRRCDRYRRSRCASPMPSRCAIPTHYLPLAQAAEEAGWTSFIVPDSICYPEVSDSKYPYTPDGDRHFLEDKPFIEPFSLIPALAAVTTRLRFTTFVVKLPIRQPVLVAKSVSSVAVLERQPLRLRRRPQPVARGLPGVRAGLARRAASAWTR